jgi:tripartite-type tricarboxylate transporter receptor subunit TctC
MFLNAPEFTHAQKNLETKSSHPPLRYITKEQVMVRNASKATWMGICTSLMSLIPAQVIGENLSDSCVARLSEAPITVVVPNEAGGGYDTYARAFAAGLEELSGETVRVSNMPAAGGRLAYTEVVRQSPDETVLLVDSFSDLVAGSESDPTFDFKSDAFTALGTIIFEPSVWLGTQGVNLADPAVTDLVVAANAVSSNLIEAGLVARALGMNMRVVAGYDGSSDTTAAVMREEADIAIMTITTALRRSKGTNLDVLLVLQDKAHASAPSAVPLGGKDGLVARRAADLSDAERQKRTTTAELAMALSGTYRGVLTGSHLDDDRLACLRTATDATLRSEVFLNDTGAQGRPVDPIFSEQTTQIYEDIRESQVDIAGELESLTTELSE